MCGIFGYSGNEEAAPILLEGLRNLEYRGYDSCGIATIFNKEFCVKKDAGKVDEVHKKHRLDILPGKIGIAHTRWATHGKVTKENAHPHLSNNCEIAAVHNGIIENFFELRNFLIKKGFFFKSETDSEVISNLIEYDMKNGYSFFDAAKNSFKKLEGQYAIVVSNNEGKIAAVRKEAPLALGLKNRDFFFASDVIAFLKYTHKIIFLEENDMVILEDPEKGFKIFNLNENSFVKRPLSRIEWNEKQAKKGNFDHFFIKEILEQAEVIERITKIDKKIIENIADKIDKARETYLVACGSAFYACMCGTYLFSKIAKRKVNFCLASEFSNIIKFIDKKSLIIAVSQSGETADTLNAVRAAKSAGAKIICISNVNDSTLIRESNETVLQNAGPEICVLSTKSYTSQIAILLLISYELDKKLEKGMDKLKELLGEVYYLTSENARKFIKILSEKLKNEEHIYVIGRNLQYPTALEAALKIKESSYMHAEAFAGGELKHGSIALITNKTPCIVFVSEENEKETLNNVMEIKARGAFVIGIGPKKNESFDFFIKVREAGEFNPVLQIIPVQILAYQLALIRGCDPDKPRNLAKSVVVK